MIAAYAIRCHTVFVYCRGEFLWPGTVVQRAIAELYADGYAGKGILGSDYDLDIVLHRGAGAYICGEETALLSSLEGFRGQPRLRPPFPAVEGLYESPTVINNVETLCNVPHIVKRRRRLVQEPGHREGARHEDVHDLRQGRAAGQLRAAAGHAVPRPARGLRGRHARRRHAEGMDARRVLDADAHRRAPRRGPRLRVDRGRGLAARHRRVHGHGSDRLHRRGRPAPAGVLRARVLRQVHARAARARGGPSACSAGSRTATDARRTCRCCPRSAGTSCSGRSARWPTAPCRRSRRRCSTSWTSTRRTSSWAGAR